MATGVNQWLPGQRARPEAARGPLWAVGVFRDGLGRGAHSSVSSDEAELARSVHAAGVEPEAGSSRQAGAGLAWVQAPVHPCLLARPPPLWGLGHISSRPAASGVRGAVMTGCGCDEVQ